MKLHHDKKLFSEAIRAASEGLNILPIFIEKDYWITLSLYQLSQSKFSKITVFKGGTSLSKAYNLISRFSEDIDLAIIDYHPKTSHQAKKILTSLTKDITKEFTEKNVDGLTEKGSNFRRSVYEYASTDSKNKSNQIIIEANSLANAHPYSLLEIESLIRTFFNQSKQNQFSNEFDLEPFKINVLDKRQTLIEKFVSLIRFSFDENVSQTIKTKIRHFYDLYFLVLDRDCRSFLDSKDFFTQITKTLNRDKKNLIYPKEWFNKNIVESPLITDFDSIWDQLKDTYTKELMALAFNEIPSQKAISKNFKFLIKKYKKVLQV